MSSLAHERPPVEDEEASAVSIKANRPYRLALRELASRRNKSIGLLVREACDAVYGNDLAPLVIFFERSGLFKVRKVIKKSNSV